MEKSLANRASKIVLICGIGCLALAAAFNNIVDYQSNFLFLQHVMTMDTVRSLATDANHDEIKVALKFKEETKPAP